MVDLGHLVVIRTGKEKGERRSPAHDSDTDRAMSISSESFVTPPSSPSPDVFGPEAIEPTSIANEMAPAQFVPLPSEPIPLSTSRVPDGQMHTSDQDVDFTRLTKPAHDLFSIDLRDVQVGESDANI